MSSSSMHLLVALCVIVHTTSGIHGGYVGPPIGSSTGQDPVSNVGIEDKLAALAQKFEDQEVRLHQLETTVAQNVEALKQKDVQIDALERKLADIRKGSDLDNAGTMDTTEGFRKADDANYANDREDREDAKVTSTVTDESETSTEDSEHPITEGSVERKKAPRIQQDIRVNPVGNIDTGVAFSVYLSSDRNEHSHETIVYNSILTDQGNGFNHGNGIYVVPASGMYVFTWSTTEGDRKYITTNLLVNGSVRGGTIADGDDASWGAATGVIVTHVSGGDHVYITPINAGLVKSSGGFRSTFSGWRLF